mgnify:CR=1 FL=1
MNSFSQSSTVFHCSCSALIAVTASPRATPAGRFTGCLKVEETSPLEPYEKELRVRYRIDGILFDQEAPPRRLQAAVRLLCANRATLSDVIQDREWYAEDGAGSKEPPRTIKSQQSIEQSTCIDGREGDRVHRLCEPGEQSVIGVIHEDDIASLRRFMQRQIGILSREGFEGESFVDAKEPQYEDTHHGQ